MNHKSFTVYDTFFIDDKKQRKRVRSVDSRKSIVEPKKRKPLTPAAQLQMHKLEFEEFLKEFELPKHQGT